MASCTHTPHAPSPSSQTEGQPADWQTVLVESIRDPAELCRLLELDPSLATDAERATAGFSLLVTRPYLARIRPGDPTDPLLLQVLPRATEAATRPNGRQDPLGELNARCGPGLLRKYQGRILMVATGACAVHCRFCFRRHFPYPTAPFFLPTGPSPTLNADPWRAAIHTIAEDSTIREVVLSGGDPLMLPDATLGQLIGKLAEIPHLRRFRLHTRLPVMIPQRVGESLVSLLRSTRLSPVVVVHVNHPAEIDREVAGAVGRLIDQGIPVLSQSVLLRDVNDRAEVLMELCQRLIDLRVIPYYLHQLDPVAEAMHFEAPISTGIALIAEIRARLPGYAVPRYVRETPGATGKEVLA